VAPGRLGSGVRAAGGPATPGMIGSSTSFNRDAAWAPVRGRPAANGESAGRGGPVSKRRAGKARARRGARARYLRRRSEFGGRAPRGQSRSSTRSRGGRTRFGMRGGGDAVVSLRFAGASGGPENGPNTRPSLRARRPRIQPYGPRGSGGRPRPPPAHRVRVRAAPRASNVVATRGVGRGQTGLAVTSFRPGVRLKFGRGGRVPRRCRFFPATGGPDVPGGTSTVSLPGRARGPGEFWAEKAKTRGGEFRHPNGPKGGADTAGAEEFGKGKNNRGECGFTRADFCRPPTKSAQDDKRF